MQDLTILPPSNKLPVPDFETPLATSDWSTNDTLHVSYRKQGVVYLANEDPDSFDTLGADNPHHALIVGGTRAGKGASFLVPNLCLWEGSAFVIDPKGENAVITARRRGNGSNHCYGIGQKVYLLDPFGVARRPDDDFADIGARYNPLDAIDVNEANAVDLVNALCSAIVTVPEQGDNAVWKEAARRLLKAVILHVLTSDDFEDHNRNLVTVYKLLGFGDQEKQTFLRDIGADHIPSAHTLVYAAMSENRAFNGMIAAEGETYSTMLAEAPKQYLGVIETLKSDLEFMDSPSMQETLSVSDFSLKDFKDSKRGIAVYLSLPLSMMETHFRWLRMMITLSLNTFESQKYKPRCGNPTMMMLDEFASLQHMPQLENGIAQMAGYGVKFVLAVQNLVQLKHVYKDNWETFVSNCGTKLFMSNEDNFTREYASKLIGEAEIIRTTQTTTDSGGTSYSETFGKNTSYGHSSNQGRTHGPGLFRFSSNRGTGTNTTTGYSESRTEGENSGWSNTTQQAIHVRPLVRPSEIGRFFAYIEEPNGVPYAGHTLVLMSGSQPFSIRKTLYYRHIRFECLFDPHPDHPFTPAYRSPPAIPQPAMEPVKKIAFVPPKPWWLRVLIWIAQKLWDLLVFTCSLLLVATFFASKTLWVCSKHACCFLTSKTGVIWFWVPTALAALLLWFLFATGLIVEVAILMLALFY